MRATPILLALLSALSSAYGSGLKYTLDPAKLSLTTVDGSSRFSKDLTTAPESAEPTQLEPDDVIRLSFALKVDGKWSKEHLPHQAVVVLSQNGDAGAVSYPLAVKPASGKVTWNLRSDRIPASLTASGNATTLSLLLANFASSSDEKGTYEPLALELLRFIPAAQTQTRVETAREKAETEQGFRGWPANQHTFGTPPTETMPARHISAAAALITAVVPWTVLAGLLASLKLEITAPTPRIGLLLTCLVGLEALALQYWISLTLFQMLPYLIAGGLVTVVVGKSALGDVRQRRLAKK